MPQCSILLSTQQSIIIEDEGQVWLENLAALRSGLRPLFSPTFSHLSLVSVTFEKHGHTSHFVIPRFISSTNMIQGYAFSDLIEIRKLHSLCPICCERHTTIRPLKKNATHNPGQLGTYPACFLCGEFFVKKSSTVSGKRRRNPRV